MKLTLFLCGAGNAEGVRLALRINEKQNRWEKIVILDDDPSKKGKQIIGIDIIGPFELLRSVNPEESEVVNLVARTTERRKVAYNKISKYGIPFTSLIDPTVDLWGVDHSQDIIIYPNVTFSAGAFIDQGSVVFTGAVIGHGCKVGKFCVIAPGAVLNARILVEDEVYIGTNASILPDLKIGAGATIGLNSGVVQNIPAGATAFGVPAEFIITQKSKAVGETLDDGVSFKGAEDYICSKSTEEIEARIIDIWKKLLNVDSIDLNDNFFDIGGNSLLAVQLYEKLKKSFDDKLTLIDIFHYPTISSFMEFIGKKQAIVSDINLSSESKRVAIFRQRFSKKKFDD